MHIVIFGLSITSSWGNGHATTYRALVRQLARRGHLVDFLERDMPWYRAHRDCRHPAGARTELYDSLDTLRRSARDLVAEADLVIVGSYVPQGVEVAEWVTSTARGVTAFYDIDTPVTLARLEQGRCEYLTPSLVPRFDLYLSFTGGPALTCLERRFGTQRARPLYCSVDPDLYRPTPAEARWDLGYLGTYSADRQASLERLLLGVARMDGRRFVVAGAQYPDGIAWPTNVERIEHVPPGEHARFYCSQRFTLNLTRADMRRLGWSPSVRLFEAAACGVPIVTDWWDGLDEFFRPGREIVVARSEEEVRACIHEMSERERARLARRARGAVLSRHTAHHRVLALERYVSEAKGDTTDSSSLPVHARGAAAWAR